MKALVTGATGFVGGAVARALVKAGIEVRTLSRKGADLQNLAGLPVEQVDGDLRNRDSLRQCPGRLPAALSRGGALRALGERPFDFLRHQRHRHRTLLEAAREVGIERTVYCSTIGAIGLPPGGGLGTEETPVSLEQMAGHYKRSKYLAEQEVLKLAREGCRSSS
jgi:dihydroflavonol-4-reductase